MNKTKPVWRKGAPPSVGWWPASVCRYSKAIRWWNGEWWSVSVSCIASSEMAGSNALQKSEYQNEIEWTDKWWL